MQLDEPSGLQTPVFEIGVEPIPGSVMVWQPGVRGGDPVREQVAIVQSIQRLPNNKIQIHYTDHSNHNGQSPSSIIMEPGETGISFIYDKLPQSTDTT